MSIKPESLAENREIHRQRKLGSEGYLNFCNPGSELTGKSFDQNGLDYFFNGIRVADRQILINHIYLRNYAAGEFVYLPFGDPDSIFFVVEGYAEFGFMDQNGKELAIDISGSGEVFGLRKEWEGSGGYARAITPLKVRVIGKEPFWYLLENNAGVSLRFLKIIQAQQTKLENKLQHIVFTDVKTRLCRQLIELFRKAGDRKTGKIKIPLTHQDLAKLIGSTRESAGIFLSELKKDGIIFYKRRWIYILSPSMLEK